jgi:biopolymer transport protein ExbD
VSFNLADPQDDEAIVAEINVTPLTDLFLVLLIIFMVTSTAMVQQGAPVNLPRAQGTSATASGVIITVTSDHQIQVGGERVGLEGLGAALAEAFKSSPDRSVVLRGDRNVVLEDAVQIMTIAKSAGAEKIAIATEQGSARGGR